MIESMTTMPWQARESAVLSPQYLPSLVRVLGTEFTGTIKSFGENSNSGI